MTSSLSSTAGDVVNLYMNLLPVELLFAKVLHWAVVCLSSLPPSHSLYAPIHRVAKCYVLRHQSPLHHLFHIMGVNPAMIEMVLPVQCCPSYLPSFSKHIAQNKDLALMEADNTFCNTKALVYCNGSGYKGNIGAAAVLFIDEEEANSLKYHLRPKTHHIVYEAEVIGILLGLQLPTDLANRLPAQVAIGSDSQAMIRALFNQCPCPTHYLLDWVHASTEKLHTKQDRLVCSQACCHALCQGAKWKGHTCGVIDLQIHWTLGHTDFQPNKRADELAKEAMKGSSSQFACLPKVLWKGPLPTNISAA
ncbi:hypothetical protein J132_03696 [Termitomyces sp. J132]|nr:hypothetical protein J132_03696 [Termitomyces sp. J132]